LISNKWQVVALGILSFDANTQIRRLRRGCSFGSWWRRQKFFCHISDERCSTI